MAQHLIYKFEPLQPHTQDHTAYWDGAFSEEELQLIEKLPEWNTLSTAVVGMDTVNPDKRITDIAWLKLTPETQFIWDKIAGVVTALNNQFFHFDINGFYEEIQLGVYDAEKGGHYGWHIDAGPRGTPRKLSFSMLLSDPSEFEGGEFQVMIENEVPISLPQLKGRAWVFPSVCLHQVTPVTKGTRKSLVVWAGGPAFR